MADVPDASSMLMLFTFVLKHWHGPPDAGNSLDRRGSDVVGDGHRSAATAHWRTSPDPDRSMGTYFSHASGCTAPDPLRQTTSQDCRSRLACDPGNGVDRIRVGDRSVYDRHPVGQSNHCCAPAENPAYFR